MDVHALVIREKEFDMEKAIGEIATAILGIPEVDSISLVKEKDNDIVNAYFIGVHYSKCKKMIPLRYNTHDLEVVTDLVEYTVYKIINEINKNKGDRNG